MVCVCVYTYVYRWHGMYVIGREHSVRVRPLLLPCGFCGSNSAEPSPQPYTFILDVRHLSLSNFIHLLPSPHPQFIKSMSVVNIELFFSPLCFLRQQSQSALQLTQSSLCIQSTLASNLNMQLSSSHCFSSAEIWCRHVPSSLALVFCFKICQ